MAPLLPADKLAALRQLLVVNSVDAYIVPTADNHNSEYPCEFYKRRQYITGFTGSAGTAVITKTAALLWTDGRYFLQAASELDQSCWTLMKDGLPDTVSIPQWLKQTDNVKTIGADAFTLSVNSYKDIVSGDKLRLLCIPENLIDLVWLTETDSTYQQPPLPSNPILIHPIELAGKSVSDKLMDLRADMRGQSPYNAILLTETPDVAWMFNLRGSDFEYNPMFLSFALITHDAAWLYCHYGKLTPAASTHLERNDITNRHYDHLVEDLQTILKKGVTLVMDTSVCYGLYTVAEQNHSTVSLRISCVKIAKAIKNEVELSEFVEAHIQDAVALCTYLCWLESAAASGALQNEDEYSVACRLEQLRRRQPYNRGLSFPSISSMGANAAIIHYTPPEKGSMRMTNGAYLIDSGGQYRGATTDVTRTIHLGTPTDYERECWTLVLKGQIELRHAVFPQGTKGPQLDVLARKHLWKCGLDFAHGTGHGVGAYLSVHEGPCGISFGLKGAAAETSLQKGMVLSNEPGFYCNGHFGIRHENLMHVIPLTPSTISSALEKSSGEKPPFFGFDDLTLVPYQRKFSFRELITKEELNYINIYHKRCWETLKSRIEDENVLSWLRDATSCWD